MGECKERRLLNAISAFTKQYFGSVLGPEKVNILVNPRHAAVSADAVAGSGQRAEI